MEGKTVSFFYKVADFPLSAHAVKLQSCGSIRETAGRLPSGCSGLQSKDSLTVLPITAKCLLIICRMVAKELQVKIKSNCSPLAVLSFPYGCVVFKRKSVFNTIYPNVLSIPNERSSLYIFSIQFN